MERTHPHQGLKKLGFASLAAAAGVVGLELRHLLDILALVMAQMVGPTVIQD
ncbi:hypothetical protein [Enterobacter kobei]|uniref:hypothetical protein n=1 Tax=Enterobacter kobei TaxID=208224 RepID=UPI0030761F63